MALRDVQAFWFYGGDIGLRSYGQVSTLGYLVAWTCDVVDRICNSRSESCKYGFHFALSHRETLVSQNFRTSAKLAALFSGFSKVWIFHTFTTWKRCELATVSSVIFAGAHKYLQSFRMSDSISPKYWWRVKKIQSVSIIPRPSLPALASTHAE